MEPPAQPDRFDLANQIFSEALDRAPADRSAFVRDRCSSDAALCQSVLRLLTRFEALDSFLEHPAAAIPSMLPVDTVLCGRFRILSRLGAGGMGEVYRAQDETLGETIALKTIRRGLRDQPAVIERFRDEIRLARRISHPNVCKIFDLFSETSGPHAPLDFFTMQFLPGETLAALIAIAAPLAPADALRIAAPIAAGLDAAHREGIVHRDLKPANILLVDSPAGWRPVITDFGLARPLESAETEGHTAAGQIVGSPDYMAPEQFSGDPVSPATDVFAFAIILYEMLAGRRPYPSESIVRAAVHRITRPPALDALPAVVPAHWRDALRRALARRPQDRYFTAAAFLEQLSQPPSIPAVALALVRRRVSRRALWTGGIAAAGAVSCSVLLSRLGIWRPALPAAPMVMLHPIAHNPADSVESGAVELTLARQLGQSSHLSLLSRDRIQHSWHLMRGDQPLPAALDSAAAREVAMRSGAHIAVYGNYGKVGDQRTLTVSIELLGSTPERPAHTWLQHFDTSRPTDLASKAGEAADWIRRTIGESASDLAARNRAPEDLTTPDWHALEEYIRGDQAFKAGNAHDADVFLKSALDRDPKFALAAARRADILRSNGRLDEALESWSQAVRILAERNLTDRESLRIQGLFASDTGQIELGGRLWERYSVEYPGDTLPIFYRASNLARIGKTDEAEHLFNLAIEREPIYPYMMGRAKFYLSRGLLDQAQRDWRAGQDLNAGDQTDSIGIGIAISRGDPRAVQAALQHLKAASPSTAFMTEACLLAEQDNLARAAAVMRDGIAFDRRHGIPQFDKQLQLARILLRTDHAAAIRTANDVLDSHPGHAIRMQAGCILAQAGQPERAAACHVAALPDWPIYQYWARVLDGEIAFASKRQSDALAQFQQAAAMLPVRVWPDYLVRAALAEGDGTTAGAQLAMLLGAPGNYWLRPDLNTPGFLREAIGTIRNANRWPDLSKKIESLTQITQN